MSEGREPEGHRELVTTEALVPALVFAEGGVDALLGRIREQALSVKIDISTSTGRQECAALAYKVARSKTALDAMGKDLGAAHYLSWRAITSERAKLVKELDALRDEVRKPLTEWEGVEKARVASHEATIDAIKAFGTLGADASSEALQARITLLRQPSEYDWQEFRARADDTRAAALGRLLEAHGIAVERETAAAEAKRLREEKAEQERRAHDAMVAEQAKREAEARAQAEAEAQARRVEAEKRAAAEEADAKIRAAEAATRKAEIAAEQAFSAAQERAVAVAEKIEMMPLTQYEHPDGSKVKASICLAQERAAANALAAELRRDAERQEAEREKTTALKAERQRIADEQYRERKAVEAREAHPQHRATIHRKAIFALTEQGLSEAAATLAVMAIAKGQIPNVRIVY
jgi:colicin import membrane protein